MENELKELAKSAALKFAGKPVSQINYNNWPFGNDDAEQGTLCDYLKRAFDLGRETLRTN